VKEAFRVLVVDDEHISQHTTVQQLAAAGYEAVGVESAAAGLERLGSGAWDAVVTDLRMPGMDGLELLRELKRALPEVDVLLMTAYGTVETAVEAMRLGASDYLLKPFRFQELEVRLRRLRELKRSRTELGRLRAIVDESAGPTGIVGRSAAIRRVSERIRLFADAAAPVLVTGETGTGKELVARALHELGPRRLAPFVALPCGAIPRELAESQFLGHEKGAFTGAAQRRKGCFEQAHGGTLLLDDVDDLPAELQAKLLRVLQEGTLVRVGGDREVSVDVRVVATTKIDLGRRVEQGGFRSDLFYRLRGLEVQLPPLRERGDDVLLLAHHFLRSFAGESGSETKTLAADAAEALRRYAWPGNVRELRRAMESATAMSPGVEILAEHLPDYLGRGSPAARIFTLDLEGRSHVSLQEVVAQIEDELIGWAMGLAQGQQTRAAEILGVPRTTLQSKLARPKGG
jgi:DNA-binding NtrC family response regulator